MGAAGFSYIASGKCGSGAASPAAAASAPGTAGMPLIVAAAAVSLFMVTAAVPVLVMVMVAVCAGGHQLAFQVGFHRLVRIPLGACAHLDPCLCESRLGSAAKAAADEHCGAKDYAVLQNYAARIDVLTIPFLINDITKATSPVKLFEYMALNKPVVTTDMDECRKYKSVLIGHDHDEFLAQLDRAYALREDAEYLELLDSEARANTWSEKARCILDELAKYE